MHPIKLSSLPQADWYNDLGSSLYGQNNVGKLQFQKVDVGHHAGCGPTGHPLEIPLQWKR